MANVIEISLDRGELVYRKVWEETPQFSYSGVLQENVYFKDYINPRSYGMGYHNRQIERAENTISVMDFDESGAPKGGLLSTPTGKRTMANYGPYELDIDESRDSALVDVYEVHPISGGNTTYVTTVGDRTSLEYKNSYKTFSNGNKFPNPDEPVVYDGRVAPNYGDVHHAVYDLVTNYGRTIYDDDTLLPMSGLMVGSDVLVSNNRPYYLVKDLDPHTGKQSISLRDMHMAAAELLATTSYPPWEWPAPFRGSVCRWPTISDRVSDTGIRPGGTRIVTTRYGYTDLDVASMSTHRVVTGVFVETYHYVWVVDDSYDDGGYWSLSSKSSHSEGTRPVVTKNTYDLRDVGSALRPGSRWEACGYEIRGSEVYISGSTQIPIGDPLPDREKYPLLYELSPGFNLDVYGGSLYYVGDARRFVYSTDMRKGVMYTEPLKQGSPLEPLISKVRSNESATKDITIRMFSGPHNLGGYFVADIVAETVTPKLNTGVAKVSRRSAIQRLVSGNHAVNVCIVHDGRPTMLVSKPYVPGQGTVKDMEEPLVRSFRGQNSARVVTTGGNIRLLVGGGMWGYSDGEWRRLVENIGDFFTDISLDYSSEGLYVLGGSRVDKELMVLTDAGLTTISKVPSDAGGEEGDIAKLLLYHAGYIYFMHNFITTGPDKTSQRVVVARATPENINNPSAYQTIREILVDNVHEEGMIVTGISRYDDTTRVNLTFILLQEKSNSDSNLHIISGGYG